MASQVASSSSSSASTCLWTYDVFLSFRGEDTRSNFTAPLYNALHSKGINTYIDNELRRGAEIEPALLKAIEESMISIVVLSKNYASSTWCLNELMKILECKETKQQLVLPVFYNVDPSEVRHQRENVGEALAKLEDRFKDDTKLQRWKEGLKQVANLAGFHLGNGIEPKFIEGIVQHVSRIVNRTYLNVAKYPVGIESRVQEINLLLRIGMNDVRMVGIFGAGGIGKTTIAKAIYNLTAFDFEASCFLANVRETSNRECGILQLQKTLLSEILGDSRYPDIGNNDRGTNVIKHRLCSKRVLVVLDDVNQLAQLEKLAGDHSWFGLGSRIIITTRDQNLLCNHEVDSTYEAKKLDDNEACQLFSWNAFKRDKPLDDYVELTKHVLHYAGGLPLALTVLGSDLRGRDTRYWEDALNCYRRIPNRNILEKLRISYNGLEENEKNIFLDIACFFKGEPLEYVTPILEGSNFFPYSGFKRLTEKCLITLEGSDNKLTMHDLLQDMGREIVRQESPAKPGKRSRLWFHEDVRYVLEENMGTSKIEGILIELPQRDLIHLNPKALKKMNRLRLFINRNAYFSKGPSYLSNELRLLDWGECPLESLPSQFHGKKLVILKMYNSLIKELGAEPKNFQNMIMMDFSACGFLTKIPDLSSAVNLKELTLRNCGSLVEIHDSVGFLDKLVNLWLNGCSSLNSFPGSIKLRSLEWLDLQGCSSLQQFPEISGTMECLKHIYLEDSGIIKLPSSIGNLTGLRHIYLGRCKNLMHLPYSILRLQHLERISLEDCSKLVELPKEVKELSKLASSSNAELLSSSLWPPLTNSSICNDIDPSSMVFPALEYLKLSNCSLSNDIFSLITLHCTSTLEYLDISRTDIISLPEIIKTFVGLRIVRVEYCKQLQEIGQLPPNIIDVYATGCMSLESFPTVSKRFGFNISVLRRLKWIELCGCHKMTVDIGNPFGCHKMPQDMGNPLLGEVRTEDRPCGIIFPGNEIPDWFTHPKEASVSNSCEIEISGLLDLEEIVGIALCAVVRPILQISPKTPTQDVGDFFPQLPDIEAEIMGNVGQRYYIGRSPESMSSDHVWLEYFFVESFKLKEESLRVRFNCNSNSLSVKSCGVHLVHKHEEKVKDHPGAFCEDVDVHLRRRDRDDGDLDSNWHPKKKKRS